ncbi:unnamed protein product [Moneuplotes crassus]|uniref:Uncharacterized protein n=1 Tax=Euplotes crassus TaxID=5936 RepID=A0AAD1XBK0_EUPCR|nr:unnamed protein product [Moneuplotes crassus]
MLIKELNQKLVCSEKPKESFKTPNPLQELNTAPASLNILGSPDTLKNLDIKYLFRGFQKKRVKEIYEKYRKTRTRAANPSVGRYSPNFDFVRKNITKNVFFSSRSPEPVYKRAPKSPKKIRNKSRALSQSRIEPKLLKSPVSKGNKRKSNQGIMKQPQKSVKIIKNNFNGNKTFGGGHFFKLGEVHEKRFEYLPIPKICTKHRRISKKIDLEKQIPRKPLFNIKQSPPQQLDLKPVSSPVRKSRTRKTTKTNKDRAGIEIYNSFDFATRLRAFSVSPSRSFKAEYWKKFRGTERPRRMDNLAYPK